MTEEHKRKIGATNSIRMKEYWKNGRATENQLNITNNFHNCLDKHKEKIKASRKLRIERLGYVNSPETRKKLGEIRKKAIIEGKFDPIKYSPFVKGHTICVGRKLTEEWKRKIGISNKEHRKNQIFPIKDTSIEIKIQNYLKELHIEFYTHKYINIGEGYQCDILIPKQETEGVIVTKKTIIECDGCYWHDCEICKRWKSNEKQIAQKEKDNIRTKELKEKGFRVIRLWEHEIKVMELNELKEIII